MSKIEKLLEDKEVIVCLLPSYEKGLGNITKVLLKSGREILYHQSLESTLKSICNYFCLHLRLIRKRQQNLLDCKYYLPLPLHKDLLLFPIKTRIPKIKNDASVAYINYFEVEKINFRQSVLHLNNGRIIQSLNTSTTLKKRYHQARLSSKFYESSAHSRTSVAEEKANYFYPATKGDIEDIKKELSNIKGLLSGILTCMPRKN